MSTPHEASDIDRFNQQMRRMGYGPLIDNPELLKRTIWGLVAENSNNRHRRELAVQMRDGTMKGTDIARVDDYRTALDKDGQHVEKLDFRKLVAANDVAMKQQGMDPDGDDDKKLKPRDEWDKYVRDSIAEFEREQDERQRPAR